MDIHLTALGLWPNPFHAILKGSNQLDSLQVDWTLLPKWTIQRKSGVRMVWYQSNYLEDILRPFLCFIRQVSGLVYVPLGCLEVVRKTTKHSGVLHFGCWLAWPILDQIPCFWGAFLSTLDPFESAIAPAVMHFLCGMTASHY